VSKFAKLYDIEDTQLLVQLTENDDGFPMVKYTTQIDGGYIQVGPVIEPKDGVDFDDKDEETAAWDAADRIFEQVDEVKAREVYYQIIAFIQESMDKEDGDE